MHINLDIAHLITRHLTRQISPLVFRSKKHKSNYWMVNVMKFR